MHRFIPGLAKLPEKLLLRLKSANGTASTIVSNVIRGISRNGSSKEYAWLAYDDEKNAMFCSSTLSQVCFVGVAKIPPVRLESGEIMRSRPMKQD